MDKARFDFQSSIMSTFSEIDVVWFFDLSYDAAVFLRAPYAVAVVEHVVRVPALLDLKQVGVAGAEIPEKNTLSSAFVDMLIQNAKQSLD